MYPPPDYHHHSIFPTTQPVEELMPRILALWENKGIRPKFHLSEPRKGAVTPMVSYTALARRDFLLTSFSDSTGTPRSRRPLPKLANASSGRHRYAHTMTLALPVQTLLTRVLQTS